MLGASMGFKLLTLMTALGLGIIGEMRLRAGRASDRVAVAAAQ